MKKLTLFRRVLRALRWPIDALMSLMVVPAGLVLLAYRRIGALQMPMATRRLRAIGVFPIRNHYYEPLFDGAHLRRPLDEDRDLPGLDLNVAGQLALLGAMNRAEELRAMALDVGPASAERFCFGNRAFEHGDAEFLYQLVRHLKPRKVIEIGSGNSTKLVRAALRRNVADGAPAAEHVCIEPYEMAWLEQLGDVQVVRARVEDCHIDWESALGPNDLLFVDSSHIIRPQGDVLTAYLGIFPRLRSGVHIHVHDIFTPRDYPERWVLGKVLFWNEQYLLEAMLSGSSRYEVVGALNHMAHHHFDALQAACPYLRPGDEPGSFYVRVR